ncbi:MAG TPA: serine--tRNA ligase [Candidatus Saccharimonadales bacterium]|nr:serine--tRNA ligase [Candidatus Saccharimonadales bacterium]
MISLELVRRSPDLIKESLRKRNENASVVDQLLLIDKKNRELLLKQETLQAKKNLLDKTAGANRQEQTKLKEELRLLKEKIFRLQEQDLAGLLAQLPNVVVEDVPGGRDARDNKVVETIGKVEKRAGLSHEELMIKHDWLDLETAGEFSGSRFRYLKNQAALKHMKLMNLAIEHAVENGFKFIIPPTMAHAKTMQATGFFPRGIEEAYKVDEDSYLAGTSEPMLLALSANKKYLAKDLPIRLVGFSTCFRREAGSYGRDVKGMFRVHQFDKVEMVSVVSPEDSAKEHEFLVSLQESFVKKFDLPYQKVLLCAADQSHIAAKQFDLETWFPSQQKYRETHSCSNCLDYQARELKIKVVGKDGEPILAHTLNGTLATERLLLAVIENNQNLDGEVTWPKILK